MSMAFYGDRDIKMGHANFCTILKIKLFCTLLASFASNIVGNIFQAVLCQEVKRVLNCKINICSMRYFPTAVHAKVVSFSEKQVFLKFFLYLDQQKYLHKL